MTAQPLGEHIPATVTISRQHLDHLTRRIQELETQNARLLHDINETLNERTQRIHDLETRLDHTHQVIAQLRAQQIGSQ